MALLVRNPPAKAGDLRDRAGDGGSIPGWGRSSGGGHSNPVAPNSPVFLPGESARTEEPGGLQSLPSYTVGQD